MNSYEAWPTELLVTARPSYTYRTVTNDKDFGKVTCRQERGTHIRRVYSETAFFDHDAEARH